MSNIEIRNGAGTTKYLKATGAGSDDDPHVPEQVISAASLPLPTGAATQATLAAIQTLIDALTTPSDTQPISAAALPLPSGAATAANQTTGNGHLATLAGAVSGTELQADVLTMPSVDLSADALNGALKSIEITLSGTPGTITTVTIPDTAHGIRLYPRTNGIRFAIVEDPAAVAKSSSTTIAAAAFAIGGVAKADTWEVRLLAAGTSRTVRLRSITASVVVDMEVF